VPGDIQCRSNDSSGMCVCSEHFVMCVSVCVYVYACVRACMHMCVKEGLHICTW